VIERQGTTINDQRSEDKLRELEAENARLKSLIGELLVTNQLLRESKDRSALTK
jgi:hypothetical protein